MRKKDVADAFFAAYCRFFSLVDTNGGDIERCVAFTVTRFFREPVCMTFTGTDVTVMQFAEWLKKGGKIHE
jgi:hypothetical protein